MNDRRKADRRVPPSVAQHAIEERAELLARIEGLVSKNDTLNRANLELCDQLHSALKSHPSGVVLPEPFEMRPFQTVDQGGTNYKAGFNAALRKVRERLNSSIVIANAPLPYWEPCNPSCDPEFNGQRSKECAQLCHQARAALTAQPDHSAQSREVPDGWRVSPVTDNGVTGFVIGTPRTNGVSTNTSVWIDDEDPAHQLLAIMFAAAPAPGKEIE